MIHAPNSYVSVTLAYNWHKITSFNISHIQHKNYMVVKKRQFIEISKRKGM
jgi:hypothetical protein